MKEIWKDINGFEGYYQVSSLGKIKSLRFNKIRYLKFYKRNGYFCIDLQIKNKIKKTTVHRLVASAFILNPLNKPMINHINGNRKDNRVENLEWVTNSENLIHAHRVLNVNKIKADKIKENFKEKVINNQICEI